VGMHFFTLPALGARPRASLSASKQHGDLHFSEKLALAQSAFAVLEPRG
jgi:hypothetical protein